MGDLPYIKRPCPPCPWRRDAEPGRFTAERWVSLSKGSPMQYGPDFDSCLFACHITHEGQEQICAGWLAQEGINHPRVRLGLLLGQIPEDAVRPKEGWPELHDSFVETMRHDLGLDR